MKKLCTVFCFVGLKVRIVDLRIQANENCRRHGACDVVSWNVLWRRSSECRSTSGIANAERRTRTCCCCPSTRRSLWTEDDSEV